MSEPPKQAIQNILPVSISLHTHCSKKLKNLFGVSGKASVKTSIFKMRHSRILIETHYPDNKHVYLTAHDVRTIWNEYRVRNAISLIQYFGFYNATVS
jgi:hypothetical protein